MRRLIAEVKAANGKIAHLHKTGLVEFRQLTHGEFLATPPVVNTALFCLARRHIDRLHDAGAESRRRIGADDTGGAEN